MSLLNEYQDDNISEITFNEDDFLTDDTEGYLYFKGEIIEKVDILFYYEEVNFIMKFVRRSKNGKIKNLCGKVYSDDNNIIDVITDLVIHNILYFMKDDTKFLHLFFNYIDSLSNLFEIKDGTLRVKLKIGFWLKNLINSNYNKKKFFWKKFYKRIYRNEK